ncbi:efflux RND transporter permease subunit [Pirellulales bacterium]|nr:efflux RND transporter permease subunit [Pirellulales bacterium]
MSDLFYRNRRLLVLAIVLIVVAGLSAYESLPRLEDPELIPRNAIVTTRFPGADAERVEALVTDLIEQELFDVEEIKTLESTSRAGISIIEVELQDEVVNVDEIWSRIRDKLNDIEPDLPTGAFVPELEDLEVRGYALITALTWQNDSPVNYAFLRRLAEGLEDKFRRIEGTENVELFGEPDEEITVEIDAPRLASMGLTVSDVSRQISQSDSKVSAGVMRNGTTGNVLIEVEGEMDSLDRIRRTPISFGRKGQFAVLGDVAIVKKEIRQPASDLAVVGGKPAVAIGVFVESDYRVDRWANVARDQVAAYAGTLPTGVGLEVVFDQSRYTDARLDSLIENLGLGAVAVVVVLLFMMGWRSAFIVGLALPLSSLMVLSGMQLLGIPMHQMSITGLILALGLLIDNAIVMVDEVGEHLHRGMSPSESITRSVRHLAIPLLGSTLTTAFAFAPIALMPGSVGEFVGTIAVSVVLALFSSLFLAMTIIPALTGIIFRFGQSSKQQAWWQVGLSSSWLANAYSSALGGVFARPTLGIAIALAMPVGGFLSATQLIEQFFPPTGRDMFQVEIELPNYASLTQTQDAANRARDMMVTNPQVRDVHWFMGKSAPSFYYNLVSDQKDAAYYTQGIVQLESADDTVQLIRRLQDELDEAFPEARVLVRQLEQGPPFDAPIELRLYGPNIDLLEDLGDKARAAMSSVSDVVHTDADLTESLPKLSIRVDEEEARLAGLNHESIARQFDATLEGAVGGSLLESTEELPIRVRLANSGRGDLVQISSLDLLSAASGTEEQRKTIPATALGEVELVPERAMIARRNGRRVNVVRGYITAGVLPGKVLADYRKQLEAGALNLPAGFEIEFGGEFAERNKAVGSLSASLGILGVVIAATLVLSFGSFRLAGIIAFVAAMSGGLGFGSLWLFGYPFGFMAIVGTMGLVGVAINDSIVVLAAIREDKLARAGDPVAVREVVVRSSRHVLATTFTTIAGFLPLILEGGGFWPPLAITIAGGVTGATLLALIFVPSAYLLVNRVVKVAEQTEPLPLDRTLFESGIRAAQVAAV